MHVGFSGMQRPYGERTKKVGMSVALKQKAFPYLVVATGIIICFGPSAMAINCAGIFFTYGERTKKVGMSVALKQKAFPYLVVATGIIICFGPSAMAINCAGIFFTEASVVCVTRG